MGGVIAMSLWAGIFIGWGTYDSVGRVANENKVFVQGKHGANHSKDQHPPGQPAASIGYSAAMRMGSTLLGKHRRVLGRRTHLITSSHSRWVHDFAGEWAVLMK